MQPTCWFFTCIIGPSLLHTAGWVLLGGTVYPHISAHLSVAANLLGFSPALSGPSLSIAYSRLGPLKRDVLWFLPALSGHLSIALKRNILSELYPHISPSLHCSQLAWVFTCIIRATSLLHTTIWVLLRGMVYQDFTHISGHLPAAASSLGNKRGLF